MLIDVFLAEQQHPDVLEELLATGSAQLVEANTRDWFWGCGSDGKGQNMLGRILMEHRARWQASTTDLSKSFELLSESF